MWRFLRSGGDDNSASYNTLVYDSLAGTWNFEDALGVIIPVLSVPVADANLTATDLVAAVIELAGRVAALEP